MSFQEYLSFESIVTALANMRVRVAAKRHTRHHLWNILADAPYPLAGDTCAVDRYLPPRNQWRRPRKSGRKGRSSAAIWRSAIFGTVMGYKERGELEAVAWGRNLLALAASVQARVACGEFALSAPFIRTIAKPGKPDKRRVIVEYVPIEDRLILAQAAKYLRDSLDDDFLDVAYSFRKSAHPDSPSHHLAVKRLCEYRVARNGQRLYAAECDIRGFYDSVGHEVLRDAVRRLERRRFAAGQTALDPAAWRVMDAYLASYCFADGGVVSPGIQQAFAVGGSASPAAPLGAAGKTNLKRVGIPQGGAISPILANVVLDHADREVVGIGGRDPDLFYARYCDDILIVHSDGEKCTRALGRYFQAAGELDLPVYKLEENLRYGASYFEAKSKGPFAWDAATPDKTTMPWVSFVGYQIRHDGEIRLRKNTVKAHSDRQTREVSAIANGLKSYGRYILKLSPWQVFNRVKSRLISLGVGRMDVRQREPELAQFCWLDAFPLLDPTVSAMRQMQALDSNRERQLARLRRRLERHAAGHGESRIIFKHAGWTPGRANMIGVYLSQKSTSYAGLLQKQLPFELRLKTAPPEIRGYNM